MRAEDKQRINELRRERRTADSTRLDEIRSEIREIREVGGLPEGARDLMAQPTLVARVAEEPDIAIGAGDPLGGVGYVTARQAREMKKANGA